MMKKIFLGSIVLALLTTAAPAVQANHGGAEIDFYKFDPACSNDGTEITIGGRAFMKEFGKHGVRKFEAKWKLYRTNVGAGWNPPYREKTQRSNEFPNDGQNFWWGGRQKPNQIHQEWTVPATNSYKLIVKLKWDRNNRRDWHREVQVTYCS